MQIKDVMISPVVTAIPNDNIFKIAKIMSTNHISSIVIVENGIPVGIATARDFLDRVLSQNLDPETTQINQIMSTDLITLNPESRILDALKVMKQTNFSQFPVMEKNKLVGIISLNDLMLFLSTFFSSQNIV